MQHDYPCIMTENMFATLNITCFQYVKHLLHKNCYTLLFEWMLCILGNVKHCGGEPEEADTGTLYPFVQFKLSVYGHTQTDRQTYTHVLQCSHASVGLVQARPN